MKAQIHQISFGDKVYFKIYAENLNGRMILVSKTKYQTINEARKLVKTMLPTYTLDKNVKEIKL